MDEKTMLDNIGAIKYLKQAQEKNKKGYSIDEKDYFQKVYEYLSNNGHDTSRLEEKLKSIVLKKGTPEECGIGAQYDEKNNSITYVNEADLYHETFHVATKGIAKKRSDNSKIANGLNEGLTDMFASKVEENSPTNYVLQMIVAKVLGKVYGEKIYDSYFNGSLPEFINQFEDKEFIGEILLDLDEYTEALANLTDGKLIESFNFVISDLAELCYSLPNEELDEVLSMIEKDLKREEIKTVLDIVEYGTKKKFDIREAFTDGIVR